MSLIPVYRSRPSALHAARAGAGAALCGALALTGALFLHPLILSAALAAIVLAGTVAGVGRQIGRSLRLDRKSTRLNSSHLVISYAVFCLKKKQIIIYLSTE